jgi:hypothetical protein
MNFGLNIMAARWDIMAACWGYNTWFCGGPRQLVVVVCVLWLMFLRLLGAGFTLARGKLMAGLGLSDQKSALAVTMPIATAFKFCIRHRKNGLLNR